MRLRLLLPLLLLTASALAEDAYVQSVEAWRAKRVAALTAPESWLSLIGLHRLEPGAQSIGAAEGNAIRLAAGPARLGTVSLGLDRNVTLTLVDGTEATIGGRAVRSGELVYTGREPTIVRFGTASFHVIERGSDLYLRVRDTEAPGRKHFAGIDSFPIDPAWRIEAQWVPFDPPRQMPITNILGQTTPAPVPGKAVFTHEGRTFELLPIDEGTDELFFVITDLTAGEETYGAARFLYADKPRDGKIVLDFNRTENPPCAFTSFATCPLPPKENRLPFRLTAGEKNYRGAH